MGFAYLPPPARSGMTRLPGRNRPAAHSCQKNRTDNAQTPPHILLRNVLAFIATMNATIRPFLAKKGHAAEEVERMHEAWCKAVMLQVTLWSRPYAKEGDR